MIGTGVIGFFVNLTFLIIRPLFGDIGKCMDPFENHLPYYKFYIDFPLHIIFWDCSFLTLFPCFGF
jgi:hypothetical protein